MTAKKRVRAKPKAIAEVVWEVPTEMIKCPDCKGRGYKELDKIGLVVTRCPTCKGAKVIPQEKA